MKSNFRLFSEYLLVLEIFLHGSTVSYKLKVMEKQVSLRVMRKCSKPYLPPVPRSGHEYGAGYGVPFDFDNVVDSTIELISSFDIGKQILATAHLSCRINTSPKHFYVGKFR